MEPKRICLWSGPRNVSTAIMYSFSQRADTHVVDEPLYAHYLRVSGADHPGRDEVLAAQDNDGNNVVSNTILGDCPKPVLFIKQMAHHLVDLDLDFMSQTTNAFLIRDPEQMLPSLINQIPNPRLVDTGLGIQAELWRGLADKGQSAPVIDAKALLMDPKRVLAEFCKRIGLQLQESQLSWPMGAIPEDGAWAPFWYHNIHKSTGFQKYKHKHDPFPDFLQPTLAECRPHYEFLLERAIR